jgi:hypothetical protein
MECNFDITSSPKFPDGRTFCPSTLPQYQDPSTMNNYHVACKCDSNPNGCTGDIYVFTDALEAARDFFWGRGCKATNVTVSATKI